jgi:hypothetical protein
VRLRMAVLFLGTVLVAGCTHTAVAAPPAAPAASAFNGTDLAWIEVNIAMDEQLLPLLKLVPERGRDRTAVALAAQVETVTGTELATLRALHDQAGLPAQNPHEGMPMPGMVTSPDLARARTLTGAGFDRFATGKVHEYLEQGLRLAGSEAQAGAEPRTLALASGIADRRRRLVA